MEQGSSDLPSGDLVGPVVSEETAPRVILARRVVVFFFSKMVKAIMTQLEDE